MNGKTCLYKELLTVVLVVSHKLTVVALERSLEKMRRDVLTGARPELLQQNGKGLGNQAVAAITLSLFNYASSTHSTPTIEINSSVISSLTRSGMWERHYTQSPMTSVPTWIPVLM